MAITSRARHGSQQRLPLAVPVEIDKLRFDPQNPRIAESLGGRSSQKQILELLFAPEIDARELVPSFIENGYLPYEPLIVRPERKGVFTVLEGNRRLAALMSMRDSGDEIETKAFRQQKLASVPCMIFEGTRDQELAYLGLRHLSKTKDWSAAAKAAFVERVLREGHSLQAAAKITNTGTPSLRVLLLTRRLFERAEKLGLELPSARTEGELLFWHLGDAVRRTNTKNYLEIMESDDPLRQPDLNESRFERLVGWIYGNPKTRQRRLITSIRDIPDLDSCLANERAARALESGSTLEEAVDELQSAGASVSGHLERAKKSVQRATAGISDVDDNGRTQVRAVRAELDRALDAFDAILT
jgi:hypothetical protein